MRFSSRYVIPAVLACLAFTVYAGALQNDFTNWDDDKYVIENKLIRQLDANGGRQILSSVVYHTWAPVKIFSYAIDHAIWGLRPVGYHLSNNVFHALSTVLLYLLLARILGRGDPRAARTPAALAAGLFAIHPVQVESVAWIAERKNVLGMGLLLGAFLAWLRASRGSIKPWSYAGFLVLLTASLMTKLHAVILPVLIALYELLERPATNDPRPSARARILLLLPSFAIALCTGVIAIRVGDVGGHPRLTGDLFGTIATAPTLVVGYVEDLLFPMNRAAILLPPVYQAPWQPVPFGMWAAVGGWMVAAIVRRKSLPHFAFFSMWFLVALLPVLHFVPFSTLAADRNMYWAAPGMFALAGLGLSTVWSSMAPAQKSLCAALVSLIAIALAALSVARVPVWKDSLSLWTDAVHKAPLSSMAREKLGATLLSLGRTDEARSELELSLRLNPLEPRTRVTLGLTLNVLGDWKGAKVQYLEALRLDPGNVRARTNLATLFLLEGRKKEAEKEFRKAILLDPTHMRSRINLGLTLLELGEAGEAEEELREALRLDPADGVVRNTLGVILLRRGKTGEGEAEFREAIRLNPDLLSARRNLATALIRLGRLEEAEIVLQKALVIRPRNARVLYSLAGIAALRGDRGQAFELLNRAHAMGFRGAAHIRSDPNLAALMDDPRMAALLTRMESKSP